MRIQHNIPAMSAYRNYTNNTSALSKNLEKLSSGYKINRAGDDAAGLAISEKMRAQITGLEVAQKNAKDGISLIQTAEGALTEVHSMLNRMYELAEQSANGTYDDDVDRTQLQKEVDQLRTEINRISQASNFNGIKLLDGSMNAGDVVTTNIGGDVKVPILPTDGTNPFNEVGTNTLLKKEGTDARQSEFTVNIENALVVNAQEDDTLTMKIGKDTELTLTVVADNVEAKAGEIKQSDAGNADAVAKAFADAFASADQTNNKIKDQAFTATWSGGHTIKFVQDQAPTNPSQVIDANLAVSITYTGANAPDGQNMGPRATEYTATAGTVTPSGGDSVGTPTVTVSGATETFYNATKDAGGAFKITISNGGNSNLGVALTNAPTGLSVASLSLTAGGTTNDNAAGDTTKVSFTGLTGVNNSTLKITLNDGTELSLAGVDLDSWTGGNAILDFTVTTTATGGGGDPAPGPGGDDNPGGDDETNVKGESTGSYVVHTTHNQEGAMESKGQLASTKIDLTSEFAKDGGKLTIGKETYVFKVGDKSTVKAAHGETLIEISDAELAYFKEDSIIDAIGQKLSQQNHEAFDLGYDKSKNTLAIHEKVGQTVYKEELKTHDGFQALISGGTQDTTTITKGTGNSLTLQIGDTSESFNKLVVDVKACNADAMGIGAIDISTQEGASAAMTAIKNAINYVSDVRGDLGATQNRLDHTINNLSVMQENIQDAESTIRDVDVAKEMMEYTKNNILVQSAQAMLAQANQLPQGVLQLLQ